MNKNKIRREVSAARGTESSVMLAIVIVFGGMLLLGAAATIHALAGIVSDLFAGVI